MSAIPPTTAHPPTTVDDAAGTADAGHLGVGFWIGAAIGAAIVAFGIHGLWVNERAGAPSAARWFIGGALVLDLVVVPLAAAAGWVARRTVPGRAWPVVRAALVTSAILIVVAAPLVTDQGGVPGNATVRPRDYDQGLLVAVGATWAVAAIWLVVLRLRRRP